RASSSAWTTVRPPTPESKMPMAPSRAAIPARLCPTGGPASSSGRRSPGRRGRPRREDAPQLRPSLARPRGEPDQRQPGRERRAERRERAPGRTPTELVGLRRDDGGGQSERRDVAQHVVFFRLDAAPQVDQQDDAAERGPLAEIRLHERAPRASLGFRPDRVAVAGQIDEHEPVVREKEVELPGASGRRAHAGERTPAEDGVQERRLADVRPARDRNFGRPRRWSAAGRRCGAEEARRRAAAHPALRASAVGASPRARFTARTCVKYVSRSAPFWSASTSIGVLFLLVWLKRRTHPFPSDVGSNLYSEVMSASLKSIERLVMRCSFG